ncbi:M23 family metallopeptidase [Erythrobacter mangrovi]|uniref:M23 family metallopeptidase n=1 Tax=Erythrobacter mangrovi TaxID=2739433 RepID=UPI001F3BE9C5|nr:M23 family metallopeptidase [Erythrobacter mangrovi]
MLGTFAVASLAASERAFAGDGQPVAVATIGATDFAVDFDDVPMDDHDEPVIHFGRAVDLAGADIEPVGRGGAILPGSIPGGLPLAGARVTSGFGMRYHPILGETRFHAGIDLAAPMGTPVVATSSGRVASAGWRGNYGILVALSHGGSVETRYAHLSAVAVRPGQTVEAGQVIGYVGSTGRSTGPHLHYETRVSGRPANPGG